MAEQNLKNHTRIVPVFHIGVGFPVIINFFWTIYKLVQDPSGDRFMGFLIGISLLLLFISVRQQILTVQDRVIRLEMRLRMRDLLQPDVYARASALPIRQLIALRFASDGELPALVRDVLSGSLTTQKEIKARVKDWQPDLQRA